MPRRKKQTLMPVGKKIRRIRLDKKISLDRIANETGCSVEYLKKIESGSEIPPVGTLLQVSRALEIDSGYLLREQASNMESRINAYAKRTGDYAYTTLTPGAENKHLKAFSVTIDAMQEHKGVGYQHEGEEFVYVVKGNIEVMVGNHVNRLAQGDSLHFNSGIQHQIKNIGNELAEMLIVLYVP
jgi:quercetin dioxygenase-like cupin family protein